MRPSKHAQVSEHRDAATEKGRLFRLRAGSPLARWLLIAALFLPACRRSTARPVPQNSSSISAPARSASSPARGTSSTLAPSSPPVTVDDRGIIIGGERIDSKTMEAGQRLKERLGRLPVDNRPVSVRAASAAKLSQVAELARALGQVGASEIDFITSTATSHASSATLKIFPLGRVPMHAERCGVRIIIKSDDMVELRWGQKGKGVTIPWRPNGPDISSVVASLYERMKTCPTTVWMLAAQGDATWEIAFVIGMAVSRSADAASETRYLMIL